jgi:hypothetical protein
VADLPDRLTYAKNRDRGELFELTMRRVFFSALALIALIALLNVFGQRPVTTTADTPVAKLEVFAPTALRGGIYYEGRFTITAREEIENATLVLDPGWLEGMTLNTLEPSPVAEANRDGRLALELGRVPAGTTHRFFLHFQVNPTTVGRRSQDVDLEDGERRLLHSDRMVTVWP